MIKIGWCLINYGPIFSPVYSSHIRAIAQGSRHFATQYLGGIGAAGATDRMYTHSAENRAVEEALQSDCTHVFLTESDMILPDDTLEKLISVDKPIVSGLYFLRNGYGQPCLYKRTLSMVYTKMRAMSPVTMFPTHNPFRLNGCPGVGCVLIQRQVFETLSKPWFDLRESRDGDPGYGSDIFFYSNCQDAGIEVWVNPQVQCGQIEYTVWDIEDYRLRTKEDPQFVSAGYIIGEGTNGL
jgi:hypothetical protein